jgi:hypothetical protein
MFSNFRDIWESNLVVVFWLCGLAFYVFAGMMLVSFHGDETNHIFNSHDYATLFIHQRPQDLLVYDLRGSDAAFLRILDSSVARYSIGLSWHLAGLSEDDLPKSGWNWTQRYRENVAEGLRPSYPLLYAARLSSTVYLAGSIIVMFAMGWQFGGRPVAYLASGLYALNPVILLNGRRALQEGSLLFFGLLTILIVVMMSRKQDNGKAVSWRWWLGLSITGALTLASKNNGFIFVASALGWIGVTTIFGRDKSRLVLTIGKAALSAVITLALFIALSPGLWSDPVSRLGDVYRERLDQMEKQTRALQDGPLPLHDRAAALLMQPFIAPPEFFETRSWVNLAPIMSEVNTYLRSVWGGVRLGLFGGIVVNVLAGWGIIICIGSVGARRALPLQDTGLYIGLLLWLVVTVAVSLANPLPWQRYFVPVIPVLVLLAGIGLWGIIRGLFRFHMNDRRGESETLPYTNIYE